MSHLKNAGFSVAFDAQPSAPVITRKKGIKYFQDEHARFTQKIMGYYKVQNGTTEPWADYRAMTAKIQNFISECIRKRITLSAMGAGWSFTRIMTTNGNMLDTDGLNRIMELGISDITPSHPDPKHLTFTECGARIYQINATLKAQGLSLKTSGASDGQTIAGVLSTGTHGAAYAIGAIPEFIVGLHLITAPDRHVWLERKSYPVAAPSFITKLGTEIIADDEIFNAALVSFGSFGFIHGVMFETEDLYTIQLYRKKFIYTEIKDLMNSMDFTKSNLFPKMEGKYPFHFQALFNPYEMDESIVTYAYKIKPVIPLAVNKLLQELGQLLYKMIAAAGDIDRHLLPGIIKKVLDNFYKQGEQTGTLGEIFTRDDSPNNNLSTAMGFHLEDIERVIEILKTNDKHNPRFGGLYSFRYVKSTTATLGFTNRGAITGVLELDGVQSGYNEKFYYEIWKKLRDAGISFTFHWGKINDINRSILESMYGSRLANWENIRRQLLEPATHILFTNEQMNQWGIF